MRSIKKYTLTVTASLLGVLFSFSNAFAFQAGDFREILQEGLLGAGVGAISAGTSGGKAGQGALIGAGTNILGSVVLGLLGNSSGNAHYSNYTQTPTYVYAQPAPAPRRASSPVYYDTAPVYVSPAPTTYALPQEDPNKKILKNGLLGAGVGAISAEASGGKAGKGALIGAGTQVIGVALMDFLSSPSTPTQNQPAYYNSRPAANYYPSSSKISGSTVKKHIIRKFDSNGNMISEEEIWE